MYCTAVGVSQLYYQWEKYQSSNNSWIIPSNRAMNITSPKLVYRLITEEDEGIYRCVVSTNRNNAVISDNATLRVYGKFIYILTDRLHKTVVCFLVQCEM